MNKKGEGTFSEVVKGQNKKTGTYVALKRFKKHFKNIEDVYSLREIQALRRLNPHPHVIELQDIIYDEVRGGTLSLVFELMECNLYELISRKKGPAMTEERAKGYMYQVCKAIEYMHRNGIFHRDIKPENILVKDDHLKLADFGSCRGIYSKQPYTEYIATRWYRPPECLLSSGMYTYKMDIWGAGCVFYEVLTSNPLFPGSNELDQVHRIHSVIGTPSQKLLAKIAKNQPLRKPFNFPYKEGTGLKKLMPSVSAECVDLIQQMLAYDADERINANQALRHPYFRDLRYNEKLSKTVMKFSTTNIAFQEEKTGAVALKVAAPSGPGGANATTNAENGTAVASAAAASGHHHGHAKAPPPPASLAQDNHSNAHLDESYKKIYGSNKSLRKDPSHTHIAEALGTTGNGGAATGGGPYSHGPRRSKKSDPATGGETTKQPPVALLADPQPLVDNPSQHQHPHQHHHQHHHHHGRHGHGRHHDQEQQQQQQHQQHQQQRQQPQQQVGTLPALNAIPTFTSSFDKRNTNAITGGNNVLTSSIRLGKYAHPYNASAVQTSLVNSLMINTTKSVTLVGKGVAAGASGKLHQPSSSSSSQHVIPPLRKTYAERERERRQDQAQQQQQQQHQHTYQHQQHHQQQQQQQPQLPSLGGTGKGVSLYGNNGATTVHNPHAYASGVTHPYNNLSSSSTKHAPIPNTLPTLHHNGSFRNGQDGKSVLGGAMMIYKAGTGPSGSGMMTNPLGPGASNSTLSSSSLNSNASQPRQGMSKYQNGNSSHHRHQNHQHHHHQHNPGKGGDGGGKADAIVDPVGAGSVKSHLTHFTAFQQHQQTLRSSFDTPVLTPKTESETPGGTEPEGQRKSIKNPIPQQASAAAASALETSSSSSQSSVSATGFSKLPSLPSIQTAVNTTEVSNSENQTTVTS